MPVAELQDRDIAVGHGSDELRDLWVAHGNANPVEGGLVESLKLDRSYTYSTNSGLARVWTMLTHGGAAVLGIDDYGIDDYGIEEGTPADFVVSAAPSPQWAILRQAEARHVVKSGQVVAESGALVA